MRIKDHEGQRSEKQRSRSFHYYRTKQLIKQELVAQAPGVRCKVSLQAGLGPHNLEVKLLGKQ